MVKNCFICMVYTGLNTLISRSTYQTKKKLSSVQSVSEDAYMRMTICQQATIKKSEV